MKANWVTGLGVCVVLLASGCQAPRDEAQLFKQKNPREARHYELKPTALEPIKYIEHLYLEGEGGLLDGVERRRNDPDELEKYLRGRRAVHEKMREQTKEEYEKIEALLEKGGKLYFFTRRESSFDETKTIRTSSFATGLVVIQNGQIVYKQDFYSWEETMPSVLQLESER